MAAAPKAADSREDSSDIFVMVMIKLALQRAESGLDHGHN